MRHLKSRNKLGVKTSHRIAMVRNLVTQLLQHKQIVTTLSRAKNIRTPVDRMIVLAKKNNLASKKRIFSFVKNKAAVKMLQEQYAEVYKNRQSGFTQIYKLKNRMGDNTPMALIRMVDIDLLKQNEDKPAVDASTTLKEVKKDIEQKTPNTTSEQTQKATENQKLEDKSEKKPKDQESQTTQKEPLKSTKV